MKAFSTSFSLSSNICVACDLYIPKIKTSFKRKNLWLTGVIKSLIRLTVFHCIRYFKLISVQYFI